MNVIERARQLIVGARAYRFEGEQENHADLLRERRVSLSMMAGANPEDPDQIRMASEIEHDAEARLTVLLGKPRLTLEEKRERDAIQAAITSRRAGFTGSPVIVPREGGWRPQRFLGAVAGIQLWHVLAVGWALTVGALGIQTALKERIEDQRDDARADLAMAERHLEAARIERDMLAERIIAADTNAQQTARNVEQERRLRARAETELRRARRAASEARSDGPIDYGFGSVRPDEPTTPGTDSGGSTGTGDSR